MIDLLTTADVAALSGVQPATVRLWVRQRRIAAIKTPGGRDYRFTWQALRDAWNARERNGTDGNNPGGGPAGDPEPAPAEAGQPPRERTPCPNDTDGDGNCGRRYCPHCGDWTHLGTAGHSAAGPWD